ncbi:MAG: GIY-YIG nuclease family protein [Flavobacterium sp.]
MSFYVSILQSKKLNRFYIGTTDDVEKRLHDHNQARYSSSFTVKGIPWDLKLSISLNDSSKAYKFEAFIKRMKSKVFIEKLISSPEMVEDIVSKL